MKDRKYDAKILHIIIYCSLFFDRYPYSLQAFVASIEIGSKYFKAFIEILEWKFLNSKFKFFPRMPRAVQAAMSAAGEPGASGRNLDAIRARVKEMGAEPEPPSCGCVLEVTPDLFEFYESGEDLISVRREFRLSSEDGQEAWRLRTLDP